MKFRITILMLVFGSFLLTAQEKLNKLKAPTSPASSILGLQPTTVLSPKSYQALETALFSNILTGNGNAIIPSDFVLEFTPYWTKNHSLSLDEYLYPKSGLDQFIRNSSISVSSTQNFLLGDSTSTNGLAFGYRTTFYFGDKNDRTKVENYKAELKKNQSITAKIVSDAELLVASSKVSNTDEFLEKIKSIVVKAIYDIGKYDDIKKADELTNKIFEEAILLPPLDKEQPDKFLDSFYNLIDKNLNANLLFNKFKTYIQERYGFSFDIAYACLFNFPTNNFQTFYLPRQSIWITPTYRFKDKASFLKLMVVLRYEWYNIDYYKKYFPESEYFKSNIDYGLSVSAEFRKFSIQFELVGKRSSTKISAGMDEDGNELFRNEQKSDLQYIGSFNYNLSKEIVLSYNVGNRFEPIVNPENTLVSTLSLNFGFGTPTEKDIDLNK